MIDNPEEDALIVEQTQKRLIELGYCNADFVEGFNGPKTQASILDFRNRNGLKLIPTIDKPLLDALATAAPIELTTRQKTATAEDLAHKVESVWQSGWAKFWLKLSAWGNVLVAGLIAVMDHLGEATEKINPIRYMLTELPGWVWFAAAGTVSGLIAYNVWRAQAAVVQGYQQDTVKFDAPKEPVA